MGRHRKRQRTHPRQVRRGAALVAAGVLFPLTGGAAVLAATGGPVRHARTSSSGNGSVHRSVVAGSTHGRHSTGESSPPSAPLPRAGDTPSARSSPPPGSPTVFAPYADVLAWPPLDVPKERVKTYAMGFVAAGDGCSAAWGGLSPVDSAFAVHRVRDVHGKVILVFGGPHNTELAQSCGDVDELAGQYREAIDAARPSGIDVFLPESALADTAAAERRTQALARVQRGHDRPLSLTLPLHRTGLSPAALGVLRSAASGGLQVAIVNLVPNGRVGQSVTSAVTVAHAQLERLYHEGDVQVWQRMGVTPVIGVVPGDEAAPFRPADARQLMAWATARGLGRLSMWSITRDAPCTADTSVGTDTCSGLDEDAGVFSKIFGGF